MSNLQIPQELFDKLVIYFFDETITDEYKNLLACKIKDLISVKVSAIEKRRRYAENLLDKEN